MTFKNGFSIGVVLGILLLVFGSIFLKNVKNKSENISQLDVSSLEYRDLDNQIVTLKEIANDKKLLINFWATWCKPCIAEFPLLNEVSQLLKDEFIVVVVSDQSNDKIESFSKKNDYNFIYLKTSSLIANGINPIPQTFILDNTLETRKHHPSIFSGSADIVVDSLRIWIK
jgi:thiol-disulfide isomerase/thioredoxin